MVFQDEQQVIDLIKEFVNPPKWVQDSREEHKKLKALVTGENLLVVV